MGRHDSQENKQKTTTQMTKLSSVVVTSAVAVLIGGGFAVIPSYGQASSNTVRLSEPFEFSGIPLCGGEEVLISGTANFVFHTTVGPNGKFIVDTFHLNYQGAKLVGMESGNTGRISESDNSIARLSDNAFEITSQVHGTLVTNGEETNTIFQLIIHTTFNGNGEPKITAWHIEAKCEG
jgi:hypothetical protein